MDYRVEGRMSAVLKKPLLVSALSLSSIAIGAGTVCAGTFQPYITVLGGYDFGASAHTQFDPIPTATYDNWLNSDVLFGASVGMEWNDVVRAELEVAHFSNSLREVDRFTSGASSGTYGGSGTIGSTYLLGNVWADWKNNSAFTPYAGGGLGVAFLNTSGVVLTNPAIGWFNDANQTRFAWQVGAGVKYQVTQSIALDLGYRYLQVQNVVFDYPSGGTFSGNQHSHVVQAGLTFTF